MNKNILNLHKRHAAPSKSGAGFTLMEIIVSTTIFVIVVTALFSLFNYTLKTSRRSDALRQATQGMRSLVEFLAKEIRNGQIDYSVVNGAAVSPLTPCLGGLGNVYSAAGDNKVEIVTSVGDRECFYLADAANNPAAGFSVASGGQMMINKNNIVESLNPQYFTVDQAKFIVRPISDPYHVPGSPKIQPFITMSIQFTAKLPTGEKVPIYYETTVSSGQYDIPTQ